MHLFTSISSAKKHLKKGCVVAIGNFDGVHWGHKVILKRLLKVANELKLPAILLTFTPHPVKVLAPLSAPPLINTTDQKITLLKNEGLSGVVLEPFNKKLASLSPADFFDKVLMHHLSAKFIIVGYDFTFGAKRQGNRETLEELCLQNEVGLSIVEPQFRKNVLVSSSLIRKKIKEGKITEVNHLLDREFFIEGEIIHGDRRGGKILNTPTANLKTVNELVPSSGVYVTKTLIGKKMYGGVTNIGYNPTFDPSLNQKIETHLFGFRGNAYKKKIRLFFLKKLREEKKFASPQKLFLQIQKDIAKAKATLK